MPTQTAIDRIHIYRSEAKRLEGKIDINPTFHGQYLNEQDAISEADIIFDILDQEIKLREDACDHQYEDTTDLRARGYRSGEHRYVCVKCGHSYTVDTSD